MKQQTSKVYIPFEAGESVIGERDDVEKTEHSETLLKKLYKYCI